MLITDGTVRDIFLINASRKLFVLHHSTSYQPTPPPPYPRVSRSSPSHHTKQAYFLEYYLFGFKPFSPLPLPQDCVPLRFLPDFPFTPDLPTDLVYYTNTYLIRFISKPSFLCLTVRSNPVTNPFFLQNH